MIRPGRPADESALSCLQGYLREPSPKLLCHGLAAGDVFVSVAEETVAGYVLPVGRGDGDQHVAELVVAPAHRREGRARRLLERVLATSERVTLLVHPGNDPARSLYESLGFEYVARRPGFYDDADALLAAREPTDQAVSPR